MTWRNWLYPLCGILGLALGLLNPFPLHHPDSSYLRARYAQNLLAGEGFSYNPREKILLTSAPVMVIGQALLSLPQGEIKSPPEALNWFVLGLAIAGLWRLIPLSGSPFVKISGLLLWLIPLWLTFGGVELWLAAFSLIALDLADGKKWLWAGLMAGLALLIAPVAIIFGILLGTQAERHYWLIFWLPAALWYGFAALYFGADGLRGLTLSPAAGQGFLGVFSIAILIALAYWLYTTHLPPLPLIMVVWSLTYSLWGIAFNLSSDGTLLMCALIILGTYALQIDRPRRLINYGMALFVVLIGVWGLVGAKNPTVAVPKLEGSKGHWGDNRQAFTLGGTVYQLEGERDPHLHDLVSSGDQVGVLLATAPDWLLLPPDNFPDDPALQVLDYRYEGAAWRRGAQTYAWGSPQPLNLDISPDLRLQNVSQDRRKTGAGEILRLRLDWQMLTDKRPEHRLLLLLQVLDAQGTVWGVMEQPFPPQKWSVENPTTYHAIRLNNDTPAGLYNIRLTVDLEGGILARYPIANIKVPVSDDLISSTPPLGHFDDGQQQADLMSAEIRHTGAQVEVNLVWRAGSRFEADYSIFVHLTRPDDGVPLAQADSAPLAGRYPTTIWEAGEIIEDSYSLDLSALPAGDYVIRVGFFNPERGRLPAADGDSVLAGRLSLD